MSGKMKPCPFCGENDSEIKNIYPLGNFRRTQMCVRCKQCGARGPERFVAEDAINTWDSRKEGSDK